MPTIPKPPNPLLFCTSEEEARVLTGLGELGLKGGDLGVE